MVLSEFWVEVIVYVCQEIILYDFVDLSISKVLLSLDCIQEKFGGEDAPTPCEDTGALVSAR